MKKHGVLQNACIIVVVCMAAAMAARAQTLTTLHSFDATDGSEPQASLVQGTDGNLYGTTFNGGASAACTGGCGTIFKITPSGTLTTLHSFDGTDGKNPWAGVIQASNGNFYGTTLYGGANTYGTVFEITSSGTLTTLHSFDWTDGAYPWGAVIQASNGSFYGTTSAGGAGEYGTIFKITSSGTLTTLYSFDSTAGEDPCAGLIQATDGNFYGTTLDGGPNNEGVFFKITSGGKLTTLYNFCSQSNCADGGMLRAGVIQGADGNFYGTTEYGGTDNAGTVFKITSSGKLTTLASFDVTDGEYPYATLAQATDGNFYGTTTLGGSDDNGTIFKVTSSGTLTTLHSFTSTDGQYPYAALFQDTNGTFYGTTQYGGGVGDGTVFSLSEGLAPFLKILTTSGKEGAKVGMLGQGFSSSSVVEFGGTPAIKVTLSGTTYLTATVPADALTGSVTVTTGTTTLTSTETFKVLPTITSIPASGSVGTPVEITGTGLTQTTKVTFGGVVATSFTVNSDTQVTATVPTGAKTGKIKVTTKGGSATSKTSFTVD
ncbi:MAG: choice-of-anchor tandem repeat GloVer-containing protein [Candidatus Sulfotelmatobacter sp.]